MTETIIGWRRRLTAIALAFATAAASMLGGAAELPPEIQADRLLLQAEREIGKESFIEAFATLDRILALQAEHGLEVPVAFWFKHAHVAYEAGLQAETFKWANRHSAAADLHAKAVQSATRYLATAGRGGDHYLEALELLGAAEGAAAAVAPKAAVEAEANAAAQEALEAVKRGEPLEMVTIPAGSYRMGCVSGRDCYGDEKPVHRVRIEQPFAMSKHEVTFAQWDACVLGGGCGGYRPYDEGWGRSDRPVINLSWIDAQLYVMWLSKQTGDAYRLPTEAEWEYAARAGTTTAYSWGNDIGRNLANCNGCGSRWDDKQTAPVGSFPANAFGLHDMHGNLEEWVLDCWNDTYSGAPTDGSAWLSGDCGQRVSRGGCWLTHPRYLRSANREEESTPGNRRTHASWRSGCNGFRVARTLTP